MKVRSGYVCQVILMHKLNAPRTRRAWRISLIGNAAALAAVLLAVLVDQAHAQQPTAPPATKAPAATSAPAQAKANDGPDQTTAVFGDWVLRCVQLAAPTPTRSCEIGQAAQADIAVAQGQTQRQTVMQVAVGRVTRTQPWRLTVVLPINIELLAPPQLEADDGGAIAPLAWQRCLPAGCFAGTELRDPALPRLVALETRARVSFKDGAGHDIQLPISMRGFAQAFDALGKEP